MSSAGSTCRRSPGRTREAAWFATSRAEGDRSDLPDGTACGRPSPWAGLGFFAGGFENSAIDGRLNSGPVSKAQPSRQRAPKRTMQGKTLIMFPS
jgi:hypothetical protein